jgi:hypothetical protein
MVLTKVCPSHQAVASPCDTWQPVRPIQGGPRREGSPGVSRGACARWAGSMARPAWRAWGATTRRSQARGACRAETLPVPTMSDLQVAPALRPRWLAACDLAEAELGSRARAHGRQPRRAGSLFASCRRCAAARTGRFRRTRQTCTCKAVRSTSAVAAPRTGASKPCMLVPSGMRARSYCTQTNVHRLQSCWHGAKCGSSIRDSPSHQSDFRRSHVRHEVQQRVSA